MQITRIKAANFYGIKNPIEISFIEGGEKEKVGYLNNGNQRISLINGFYGSNASGKSTLLNVIDVMNRLMINRFPMVSQGAILDSYILLPNYCKDMHLKPTEMEMDFVLGKDIYGYMIHIRDGKDVDVEVLRKNGKQLFSRKGMEVLFNDDILKRIGSISKNIVAPKSASFLSVLLDDASDVSVFGNMKELIGVAELTKLKDSFCFITDKRSVERGQGNLQGLLSVSLKYLRNSNEAEKEQYITRISNAASFFEPKLRRLIIRQDGQNSVRATGEYEDFYNELPMTEFSAGTRELISYIDDILQMLKVGGVLVYDETSKYYHPDMENLILNLFKNKNINTKSAQIFFSSHNHETFDLLYNDQAYILEKDEDMEVTAHRVSDYDIEERDNKKKKYRLGVLGGVPDTIEFNRIINNLLHDKNTI
ncbi:MAG: ATP-binding protein [Candidatus Pacebacteria bacterium]|nr:ATP-binding protein [Candidatus Paceibacterota bacterium]